MKKLVGLVVVLAALVLGGYYGMGIATERTVKRNLEAVNKTNGLHVNILKYKRGWFTSTAKLDWLIHVPEHIVKSPDGQSQTVAAEDYKMQMPLTIYHGPIIFANRTVKFGLGYANTDIHLPSQYNEKFNAHFTSESTQPVLDLSLFVSYLNNSTIEMAVPTFKLIAKDGGQLDWMGMNSSVNVTSDAKKIDGDFTVDGLQFSKDDTKAVLGEVTSEYELHKTATGLYLGDASMSVPSLVIHQKEEKLFELTQFDVHSSSDIEDGLFSSHFKSSLEKIMGHGKTYGPGNLEMAIRNLDADVLGRINQQVNHAQQGTDVEKQQALLAILPEVPKLFSRGAEFEISELSFTMPQGTIEGTMLVTLPKGDSSNPFELIQKIQGKSKLRVPAEVVKMVLNQANKQKIAAQAATSQQAPDATTTVAPVTSTTTTTANTATTTAPATTAATDTPVATTATPDVEVQAAAMTDQQIASITQSGLVVKDGDYFVIEVALEQGNLQVNGKPFNPAMVKF
ncbi:MAG: YdgA family protein [Legionella sp.]|nr:YdgA family protein [Legionella sp.]